MTNNVTYSISLIPENAAKIDAINKILLGDSYSQEPTTPKKSATNAKEPSPQKSKDVAQNSSASDAVPPADTDITLESFKSAAKKAKSDHGEEFTMAVLKEAGVEVAATLGRSMSKVDGSDYKAIMDAWLEGPQTEDDPGLDDLDDGLDDDDEEESEVTAEAVKLALKAYAKEKGRDEAKAIMIENGASALSKVDDCTPKQLSAMISKLV